MIDYEKLPEAPSSSSREEMIEIFKESPDYIAGDEVCEGIIANIEYGFIVLIGKDHMSITKEGYDHYQEIMKRVLN